MNRNGSSWFKRERFDLTRPFDRETRPHTYFYIKSNGNGQVEIVPMTINPEKFAALQLNPIPGDEENVLNEDKVPGRETDRSGSSDSQEHRCQTHQESPEIC